mmetsp:Transcript_5288/g.10527  ORF Transcript_5288/g.10527 Transcript_5288/m.10527 type:complete len:219 (+) Transcript_5288:55-711(+)|eukprot:CAMPEP_0180754496 /NCGR_PEP_ID=MMETSP1038_2-20121128/33223_1 /TAXON_ID=632150 /ORGANISM="Azadinium spinosum, Strain 3D9" /LENGTH=218 /DNA_ID=CAMNT_0022788405 /DNA_START=6 /DNA_END=662 /DNA_ORIENTATION=-
MFAIVAGPLPVPAGTSPEDFEKGHAARNPTVVAKEPGCMVYQLTKTKKGEYYILELYKDKEALDLHFNNMGSKNGAPPPEKLKPDGMLKILPVVSAIVKEGSASIANVVKLPMKDGALFEEVVTPAMVEMDRNEPDTATYILAKSPDGNTYFFVELFKDQAAIDFHSKADAFKVMNKKMVPAIKGAPGGKPDFSLMGMAVCGGNVPRKMCAAMIPSKM